MPVSDPNVLDAIGINKLTGQVQLRMYEERDWADQQTQLMQLQNKIDQYLNYVFEGKFREYPEYEGKSIVFMLHCQYEPPGTLCSSLQEFQDQLYSHNITFKIYIGPDESRLHQWHINKE